MSEEFVAGDCQIDEDCKNHWLRIRAMLADTDPLSAGTAISRELIVSHHDHLTRHLSASYIFSLRRCGAMCARIR
jgi:hypothetical protein